MLGLIAALVLSPGPKGFFEDPAYLLGLPLLVLGAAGIFIALSPVELRWPQALPEAEQEFVEPAEGHPAPAEYVRVGLILAAVTALEVAVYYIDALQGALLGILMVLSFLKFALVALWFMHLRFDSRVFSILFTGGLMLAVALFLVVLASLGSSLV